MERESEVTKEFALENIISTAVQVPGVRVNRDKFLAETFAAGDVSVEEVLEYGPIKAGCSRELLSRIANRLILKRTSESSLASFAAGLPGGLAMAATIPVDVLQFFGMTLRLAQELSYLYGAQDLWQKGEVDDERVRNQLILYCGVMFGVSSAAAGVRILSAQVAKTALQKIPQKALTKTFWYPLIKQIGKAVSVKVTKSTVAKGFSKIIPVIGGVISGSLNFASMMPMAKRLLDTLDRACFDYSEEEMISDFEEVHHIDKTIIEDESKSAKESERMKNKVSKNIKTAGSGISDLFYKLKMKDEENNSSGTQNDDIILSIERLGKLKDMEVITQEEFEEKKKELLAKL